MIKVSTSVIVRKLGTLKKLLPEHGPTRDDVMAWAREEARIETIKYKEEKKSKSVQITFHADSQINYDQRVLHRGGYLFLQSFYYRLHMDKVCRKLRDKYKFKIPRIRFTSVWSSHTLQSMRVIRRLYGIISDSYTCDTILSTLKSMNFACVQEQGFIPLYKRDKLTDKLHEICNFRTDYEFITKKDSLMTCLGHAD